MPPTFLAVVWAYNYASFRQWCLQWRIDPRRVIYLNEVERIYGLRDYKLILLDGWYDRKDINLDERELIFERAAESYHLPRDGSPVVEDGRIVGWNRNGEEK